ncbi:hypothetical protein OPT61_g1057 [Boeremia exigua]|uniref:Uncharacterized protein n=1 Tax=Boeremia exigua TaxID=749465 RepID=A0ACC2IRR8_9PLEO|nr:hypothetical protein OPT61_g1057 [Boeremia exigua]
MLGHCRATIQTCFVITLFLIRGGVGVRVGGTEFKERGTQHSLKEDNTKYTSSGQNSSAGGIMGYGGSLTLVNGSPFEWKLSSESSYQMDAWKWPNVAAGEAAKVYVEFGTRWFGKDDAGEAYYDIAGTSEKFSVLGKKSKDYELTISLTDMATEQSPKGSKVELGFRHDAAVNWIMSTDEAGKWWSNSGTYVDWMQQSMGSLANRTLNHICMPGSHDAGMGTFSPGTVGAHFANTQTQYLDFKGQLMAGSRYFDLRPVISNGQWVAGHYSGLEVGDDDLWVGGNGQSLDDIIKQINDFTAEYKELVIINLSHTLDTDNDYKELDQKQWDSLFDKLKDIKNRHTVKDPGDTDFSTKVLGDFITDRASVFVLAQLPSGVKLGSYASQGFYESKHFPFYDSYSNSNDLSTMRDDQLEKLKTERNIVSDSASRKEKFHILSWTLTQQAEDVLNLDRAILNMNAETFDDLVEKAWNAFSPESFPNVLFVDALGIRDKSVVFPFDKPRQVPVNNDIAALAIAVNNGMAGRNKVITGK